MNKIFILLPGSCARGGTRGCWGSKTLAWGFAMAPHQLRYLVMIYFTFIRQSQYITELLSDFYFPRFKLTIVNTIWYKCLNTSQKSRHCITSRISLPKLMLISYMQKLYHQTIQVLFLLIGWPFLVGLFNSLHAG